MVDAHKKQLCKKNLALQNHYISGQLTLNTIWQIRSECFEDYTFQDLIESYFMLGLYFLFPTQVKLPPRSDIERDIRHSTALQLLYSQKFFLSNLEAHILPQFNSLQKQKKASKQSVDKT